jgi:hypothetical protein
VSDPIGGSGDLGPGEGDGLAQLARRLREARPAPAPAFVGRLRRTIIDTSGSAIEGGWRVPALISGCALAGTLLLGLGVIGAAGAGPFGG